MALGISILKFKALLESNPLKSRVLVRRLGVAPLSKEREPAARAREGEGGGEKTW